MTRCPFCGGNFVDAVCDRCLGDDPNCRDCEGKGEYAACLTCGAREDEKDL